MKRLPRSAVAVLLAAVAFTVAIGILFWGGGPVDERTLLSALVSGIALGSIYAVAATGLVVTYTTSGVFNFAQGAIGMFMAFLYWELRYSHNVPAPVALVLVVLVAAPLSGVMLDKLLMRHLQGADLVVQLMVTVGLMLGLMGIAAAIWSPSDFRSSDFFFGAQSGFHIGTAFVLWHRAIGVIVGVVIAIGLRVLLFRTRLGVAMRAVVDNRELARLNGVDPNRVSMVAWAIGCTLAAIAGILLAPEVLLNITSLTLLIVDAFAAAILGRLRNLPLTFAGGLLLGLLNAFALGFLDFSRKFAGRWSGLPDAIPTIFLFFVLLALPQAQIQLGRRISRAAGGVKLPTVRQAAAGAVVLVVVVVALSAAMPLTDQTRLLVGLVTSLVIVSLVPLTGWAGEVNLSTITFVGVGALGMSLAAGSSGNPAGLLAAAALAVPFGVAMSLPGLRLTGLYLALASMAFARMAELLFFPQPSVFGSSSPNFAPLSIFGYRFASQNSLAVLCAAVFGLVGVGLVAYRRSRFGRRLIAMRDSPAASATLGINLRLTKLSVYAVSAALAGLAGALLALQQQTVGQSDFTMVGGLQYPLLLVIGGITLVSGALAGGVFAVLLVLIQQTWHLSWLNSLEVIGPGLAALGMVRNPRGVTYQIAIDLAWILPWRPDARAERRQRRGTDPARLGLQVRFSDDEVQALDRFLALPAELTDPPGEPAQSSAAVTTSLAI